MARVRYSVLVEHHKSESEYNLHFFVQFLSAKICVLYLISNLFSIAFVKDSNFFITRFNAFLMMFGA